MADLNQFLNKDTTADDITGGGAYGLTGSSFDQRTKKLDDTRVVGSYRSSLIGGRRSTAVAKTAIQDGNRVYDASTGQIVDGPSYGNNRQAGAVDGNSVDKSVERRQHYIEPAPRNYDKYAG